MEKEILHKIDEIADEMICSIKKIVSIKSIQEEASKHMPYGKGISDCLNATLTLAKQMGFEVENIDEQVGIVKYGKRDDYIGIFGHLDVVEVGDGWDHPPFVPYENEKGRIFARGILDNKGPMLSNLYALYVLKELNIQLKHPIWLIFGTNEESGFHDMHYYLTKKKPPIMGWTPDCKYPVVYAERGRSKYQISASYEHQKEFNAFVNEYLLEKEIGLQKLGLDINDSEFGKMQMRNVSLLDLDILGVEFVFSYPAIITNKEIQKQLETKITKNLKLSCTLNYNPVHFEKDGYLCQTLKSTYEDITGLDGTPVTTTGGTYAKIVPNIVPFGPSFPGQKGIGHNPNEWMDRKDLITNAKIYAISMYRVANDQ